jgi:uncharacterized protein YvpB
MHLKKVPAIHFRWTSTTSLKWALLFFLIIGCGFDSTEPPAESEKGREAHQMETYNIQANQDQNSNWRNLNEVFNIPIVPNQKRQEKILIDAPHIKQKPELPRGCEVTSLAMLLNHAGVSVDKMTLAKQIKKVPFQQNGLRGNMNDGFVGNMYTFNQPGIGVYHGPIKNLAESYLPGKVIDFTGKGFNEVIAQLDKKRPVWVLVTSTFDVVPERYWSTWQTNSGPLRITYKMHSVLVTGYDQNSIYVNDPLSSKNRLLPRKQFIAGWEQMGKQAITVETKL